LVVSNVTREGLKNISKINLWTSPAGMEGFESKKGLFGKKGPEKGGVEVQIFFRKYYCIFPSSL